jgi:hypothetical protein
MFDLHFFSAYAMSFIPMKLCITFCAISQTDTTDTLQLPPSASPLQFTQSCEIMNFAADGNRFYVFNLTD